MTDKIPAVLDAVFECTLNMINQDMAEWPERASICSLDSCNHIADPRTPSDRLAFFRLLRAVNSQCFDALLKLPQAQFKLIMDSIVWGIKHTMRDIADIGLTCAVFPSGQQT